MNKVAQSPLTPAFLAVLLWFLPLRWVFLPFDWLYVQVHELCHALAAMATGASGCTILIDHTASGVTIPTGACFVPLVAAAGYVGSTIAGSVLIVTSRTDKGAKNSALALSIALLIGLLAFDRSWVGWFSGVCWVACLFAAYRAPGVWARWLMMMGGTILCLASLEAVFQIFGYSRIGVQNDAMILQSYSGIPAGLSAILWSVISLVAVILAFRFVLIKGKTQGSSVSK